MAKEIKKIISAAFGIPEGGRNNDNRIWTNVYRPALPLTPQDFDLGAVWPMVMYSVRWNCKRGRGNFGKVFIANPNDPLEVKSSVQRKKTLPTISSVSRKLFSEGAVVTNERNKSRADSVESILGDLLLSDGFENIKRDEGQNIQIQRAYPTHFFSSWIDLPEYSANLRGVPELIVSILRGQDSGVELDLGIGFTNSDLPPAQLGLKRNALHPFGIGTIAKGRDLTNLSSDTFDERAVVSLDQLLTIRIAQLCGRAPEKLAGAGAARLENLRPISASCSKVFKSDLDSLLVTFGGLPQRRLLNNMIEASLCLSLTLLVTSTIAAVEQWEELGHVTESSEPFKVALFVDTTNGQSLEVRNLSEASAATCKARFLSLSAVFMRMRILDFLTERSRQTKELRPNNWPNSTDFLNFLGDFAFERHAKSDAIADQLYAIASQIDDDVALAATNPTLTLNLEPNGSIALSPTAPLSQQLSRLADFIQNSIGPAQTTTQFGAFWRSVLSVNTPLGLGKRRDIWRQTRGRRTKKEAISIVLSNVMLDYLVHIHTAPVEYGGKSKSLSYPQFLELLRTRYGLYIDQAPDGESISGEVLELNRRTLEARLRELGLLVGVNDAETMKRLRPRFKPAPTAEFYAETEFKI